ncbi:type 1 glutamine amidotransferase domain-containing protein [Aliiglaciecola litoralis]|uniref:Type 1 glutamine amidotransferase domain-containing protein n=1 Tax=Aliiglaciecola litoralis TaxID=582857 RepID=A0ABP3WRJ4_9ALTE
MSNEANLANKTIAIIATDGFEQSELFQPKEQLTSMGAEVHIISIDDNDSIRAWDQKDWGKTVDVDKQIDEVSTADYDAVVLPGGQINPDVLRMNDKVVDFIKSAYEQDNIKVLAAICHGPWLMVEAAIVDGKQITSYPSIRTDLRNAGAKWQDKTVVVDGKLITSRNPDDLPNFIETIAQTLTQ